MRVTCVEVMPLLREALRHGGRVRLTATGMSMRPFIRSGDVVELAAVTSDMVMPGIVALVEAINGKYVLHRVTRRTANGVFTRGDANFHEEGPFSADGVMARATGILRGNRVKPLDTGVRALMARVWHATRAGVWLIEVYDSSRQIVGWVLRRFGLRSPLAPPP